jgi:hypothetical protein
VRLSLSLLILLGGLALSAVLWFATGGRVFVLFLPLLFATPLLWRRPRG